jgi:hypothetical protein
VIPTRDAYLRQRRTRANGHDQPAGLGQVGSQAVDDLAFERRGAHQPEVAHREVAKPAVNQLRGAARGSHGKVLGLEQGDPQAAQARGASDARSRDAAPDHHAVERLALEAFDRRVAGKRRYGGNFGHPDLDWKRLSNASG